MFQGRSGYYPFFALFVRAFVPTAAFAFFICLTASSVIAADRAATPNDLEKQMEAVKVRLESAEPVSPAVQSQYDVLASLINSCALAKVITDPFVKDLLAPAANLCISGSLATTDRTFNRPLASSTGTGVGNGVVGNCSLSGTATTARYDAYSINVTGCATFPTEVTATLCGPAGCQQVGNVDTVLVLYRNVAAGDPLTANGGLPGVFNRAAPCTNARAEQDDLGTTSGTPNNPGGSTCNQTVGANCVAPCTSPSNAGGLSGFRRNLGSGQFTLVVTGFGNATVGNYNLYLDAPAAGCQIALAPTAAGVSISGSVVLPRSVGLTNALVTLTDMQGNTRTVFAGKGGRFRFTDVQPGATYIVSIASKRYTFAPQTITVNEDLTGLNFFPTQ